MLWGVTDELKPPVAIRITRPYATEAEFLEREFDTLTHTSVVLLGAQARPQGVVLRFEIVLKNGESILRGEGRVVAFKERAYAGEPGLSLRFTRLDSRSKNLVDRASALRDARVKASTSLMSMPAVVVPKPAASTPDLAASPPAPASPAPPLVNASEQAPRVPAPPARISTPPPARRSTPPPLPAWAKLVPPVPPQSALPYPGLDIPIDVESTQVDAHFDLPPALPAPPLVPAPAAVAAVEAVAAPAPPPARQPIRPTPSRPPPPLPASVPVRAASAGAVAANAPATSSTNAASRTTQAAQTAKVTELAASRVPDRSGSPADRAPNGSTTGAANTRERRGREPSVVSRPDDREAILTRLRDRAHSLSSIRVAEILAKGTR
jgi:hypothetical protein